MKRPMESHPAATSSQHTITREALRARIESGNPFFLFEVLPEMYYRKHHLPGAIQMSPADVEGTVTRLVPDKTAEIVLYCWDDH